MLQIVRGMTLFCKKSSGAWCVNLACPLFSHHAEYDSHNIVDYLNDVNNVPEGYVVGKLCTEDAISVSRQFSLKFHAFFNQIIIKEKVLGTVDHYTYVEEEIPRSRCFSLPCVPKSWGKYVSACA